MTKMKMMIGMTGDFGNALDMVYREFGETTLRGTFGMKMAVLELYYIDTPYTEIIREGTSLHGGLWSVTHLGGN